MEKKQEKMSLSKHINIKVAAIIIIIISALSAYALSVKASIDKWDEKIYSGVNIEDLDLSGKTNDEAQEAVT